MARHGAGWVCHWRGLCAERMSGCTVARLVRTAPQAFLKSTTQAECTKGTTGTQATKHVMAQPCAGATEDLRLASPVCCLALGDHCVWVPYPLGQRTCCYHHINLTGMTGLLAPEYSCHMQAVTSRHNKLCIWRRASHSLAEPDATCSPMVHLGPQHTPAACRQGPTFLLERACRTLMSSCSKHAGLYFVPAACMHDSAFFLQHACGTLLSPCSMHADSPFLLQHACGTLLPS